MPKISVIVPVYKVEPFLSECVNSVLEQSFRDFDLILVDDGSPDSCPQICDAYAQKDERVHVIHKENGGLSSARNAGIDLAMEHSSSEWLAFVDSDDYLHKNYLSAMYQAAKEHDADLVVCDYTRVDENGNISPEAKKAIPRTATDDKGQLFELYLRYNQIVYAWNKLYQKRIFKDLRFPVGKIHEDVFVIHHVLWNCRRAAFLPDGFYYYRSRSGSIMANESTKSKLDKYEGFIQQYRFCLAHQIPYPKEFLLSFSSLKHEAKGEEKARYKNLRAVFKQAYFSDAGNRNLKRALAVYCTQAYRKAAGMRRR